MNHHHHHHHQQQHSLVVFLFNPIQHCKKFFVLLGVCVDLCWLGLVWRARAKERGVEENSKKKKKKHNDLEKRKQNQSVSLSFDGALEVIENLGLDPFLVEGRIIAFSGIQNESGEVSQSIEMFEEIRDVIGDVSHVWKLLFECPFEFLAQKIESALDSFKISPCARYHVAIPLDEQDRVSPVHHFSGPVWIS